ncbi:CRISPR-associated endonuclease Cas3'' [Pseudoalteromonas sp. L23]|uniref:CRISPR-associated endonuclease Cas3'' n=1 Tax=unclassified Pseudoalteromonas TaxID=194690 RepID=UPI001EEFA75E|nr:MULTISPECIES: CRISPR-associated endonuclease Cas3'' [unclassified Pseudoalteromonas]MCF7515461.1 CRISPR-associated endonuclease Cas3'' [Pseudoalteromonas sp. L7]MCF7527360.1 CRISPR-associated endonuclease Cas3'' [Pseudoalteromonas sp. L23]MCX2767724.1 CRISPR-associated endonuclease Cas3'' [Pseudoalteromonas sp. B530]
MSKYFGHSGNNEDKSDWQPLRDHLCRVASGAELNSKYFKAAKLSYLAGLLHDLGKYSPEFQARLEGVTNKVDHATAGAKIAAELLPSPYGNLIAYAIAGHHTGLANGSGEGAGRRALKDRLNLQFGKDIPALDGEAWQSELVLPPIESLIPEISPNPNADLQGFQFAFLIRMIFSCLVDSDFIDTDKFYKHLEGKPLLRGDYPQLAELKIQFDQALADKIKSTDQTQTVNQLRKKILDTARIKAKLTPGLFTLTVPTGGGKTFSSMAFALDHALAHNMRRVIYVIPFTSIIEQNAKVFREAFGDLGESAVLEHHSNFDDSKIKEVEGVEETRDKLKLAMENWDMPVIVTTAVQFFESLFADRPSRCRKLHNISGSVIILDEAQTLPLKFLRPVMAAIDELARNYGCSVVLCTATQPALCEPDFTHGFKGVREIAPDPTRLFDELSLVNVSHLGELSDDELVSCIQANKQTLTIVNNRRHAQSLFLALKAQQTEGVFHLTTLMCAAHRTATLDEIRKRLNPKKPQPCRVISTSLIEAGVDVSFPCVMRAEAGLDSIAQAAGRCNRERLWLKADSHVWIFRSPDWPIPPELKGLSADMRAVLRKGHDNLLDQMAIKDYFSNVYWRKGDELDQKQLLKAYRIGASKLDFPFQRIASDFRMIDSFMCPVLINYNDEARKLLTELESTDEVSRVLRKLQPYIVQIPQSGFDSLRFAGVIQTIAPHRFDEQFWELVNMDIYDSESGLSWNAPNFIKTENLVW